MELVWGIDIALGRSDWYYDEVGVLGGWGFSFTYNNNNNKDNTLWWPWGQNFQSLLYFLIFSNLAALLRLGPHHYPFGFPLNEWVNEWMNEWKVYFILSYTTFINDKWLLGYLKLNVTWILMWANLPNKLSGTFFFTR